MGLRRNFSYCALYHSGKLESKITTTQYVLFKKIVVCNQFKHHQYVVSQKKSHFRFCGKEKFSLTSNVLVPFLSTLITIMLLVTHFLHQVKLCQLFFALVSRCQRGGVVEFLEHIFFYHATDSLPKKVFMRVPDLSMLGAENNQHRKHNCSSFCLLEDAFKICCIEH